MAKVELNPVMEKMSGKIGDLIFKRYQDEVVVSRKANRANLVPTPAQVAHNERFRQATVYAKASLADPVARAIYEAAAKEKGKPVFALAVGDYLNAPSVDFVDLAGYSGKVGEKIVIRASDDIGVVSVNVSIRSGRGVVEQGPATFEQGSWRYTTQAVVDLTAGSIAIDVTAFDRPGNRNMKTEVKG